MKKPDLEFIAQRLKVRQEAAAFTDPNVKEFADQALEALELADTVIANLIEEGDRPATCADLAKVLTTLRQLVIAVPAVQNQMTFSMTLDHLCAIREALENPVPSDEHSALSESFAEVEERT